MSDQSKIVHRTGKGEPFVHRLSRESLLQFRDASVEAKLQWLEEANAFVGQFVTTRKLERWRAFVMNSERKARDKRREA